MSRRHKETEIADNNKSRQAESHADGSPRVKRSLFSGFGVSNFSVTKRDGSKCGFSLNKVISAITSAFEKKEVEVDDNWVKIPRRYFDDDVLSPSEFLGYICERRLHEFSAQEDNPKRGHPRLKQLINKFKDCEVVGWFKSAWAAAKSKALEFYQDLTQMSVCFLRSIHLAFSSEDDDPYGKVSHYHQMLENEIPGLPSRETISRNYRWFVNWKALLSEKYEDAKHKKERYKHWLWERLIEWIRQYLLELAPQYAT